MRSRIRGPTTGGIPRLNDIVKESSEANDNSSRSIGHRQFVVAAYHQRAVPGATGKRSAWRPRRVHAKPPNNLRREGVCPV